MRKIIWTRSESERLTDQRLFPDPARVIWVPCIEIHTLTYALASVLPPYAFAFTSAHAVEEVKRHPGLLAWLQQAVWVGTFGEKTFQKLRKIEGITPCLLPADSAKEFAQRLVQEIGEKQATWVLPGPKTRAFSLALFLETQRWRILQPDLYETHAHVPSRYAPHELLALGEPYTLCVASPSAAHGFCEWLPAEFDTADFQVYVLGESTRLACTGKFPHVKVVQPQSLEALASQALKVS
jgi:uroporphyrinogen-III synthase